MLFSGVETLTFSDSQRGVAAAGSHEGTYKMGNLNSKRIGTPTTDGYHRTLAEQTAVGAHSNKVTPEQRASHPSLASEESSPRVLHRRRSEGQDPLAEREVLGQDAAASKAGCHEALTKGRSRRLEALSVKQVGSTDLCSRVFYLGLY